jgi:hypothetical protein
MNTDVKTSLTQLRESNPALFNQLIERLKQEAARESKQKQRSTTPMHSLNGPVDVYATCVKHYKCIHCGYKWERTINMRKGDTTSWCSKGFAKQIVTVRVVKDPIHINADVPNCCKCGEFVSQLSREELEYRYLDMLHSTHMVRLAMQREKESGKGM